VKDLSWWQKYKEYAGQMAQEMDPLHVLVLVKVHHHEIQLFFPQICQKVVVKLSTY
jgi:hypothetical protein